MRTSVDLPITMKREELLAAIEARRQVAEKTDAAALKVHRKEEAAYLKAFTAAMKIAATWTYEEAKKHHFDVRNVMPGTTYSKWGYPSHPDAPSCPAAEVDYWQRLHDLISKMSQPRFTLSRHGKWSELYQMVTEDVTQQKGLC